MTQKLLQVNLTFSVSRADLETAWLQAAQPIADARKHAKALGRRRTELRAQDVRIENADGLLIEYGPICR